MRNWINVVSLNARWKVDSIETFMAGTAFSHPIDLEVGPDGVLYVLEYGTYWFAKNKDAGLYRIEYNRGNRAPVAALKADVERGSVPLTVRFSSEGTLTMTPRSFPINGISIKTRFSQPRPTRSLLLKLLAYIIYGWWLQIRKARAVKKH
jgi:hypothetical protein